MICCIKCGVELEDHMDRCPICGQSVLGADDTSKGIEKKGPSTFSPRRRLKWGRIRRFLKRWIPAFKRIFHT